MTAEQYAIAISATEPHHNVPEWLCPEGHVRLVLIHRNSEGEVTLRMTDPVTPFPPNNDLLLAKGEAHGHGHDPVTGECYE